MTDSVLICIRGFRTTQVLDRLHALLNADTTWTILHVIDSTPRDSLGHALRQIGGHGERAHHAIDRLDEADRALHLEVHDEITAWLATSGRLAEILLVEGQPEHEILRVAHERVVGLIAIGDLSKPGPGRLTPVVQFVMDHAPCDVILIR